LMSTILAKGRQRLPVKIGEFPRIKRRFKNETAGKHVIITYDNTSQGCGGARPRIETRMRAPKNFPHFCGCERGSTASTGF
jgi:hypothetical protein